MKSYLPTFIIIAYVLFLGINLVIQITRDLIILIPIYVILITFNFDPSWALVCRGFCPPTFLGWFASSVILIILVFIVNFIFVKFRQRQRK